MNFCGLKRIKTIVDTWISGVSVSWAIELILVFVFLMFDNIWIKTNLFKFVDTYICDVWISYSKTFEFVQSSLEIQKNNAPQNMIISQ